MLDYYVNEVCYLTLLYSIHCELQADSYIYNHCITAIR